MEATPLALLAVITTVLVFLSGFLSVRVHAHRDRALARYEQLLDRAIDITQATASYPRPSEFIKIRDEYDREMTLDWASLPTVIVCVVAWLVGGGLAGVALFLQWSSLSGWDKSAVISTVVLLSGVLTVTLVDFAWATGRLRSESRRLLPSLYETAMALLRARRYGEAATLFEQVVDNVPRWPWAIFWLACCYQQLPPPKSQRVTYLSRAVEAEVSRSNDPVDKILLAAALRLRGVGLSNLVDPRILDAESAEYPDLKTVIDWLRSDAPKIPSQGLATS